MNKIPLGRFGDVEEYIGRVAVFLTSEDSRYITWQTILVDGNNLFELIHSIEKISNEHIVEFTSRYSYPIGVSAVLVLAELRNNRALRQSELVEMLGYTKGAVMHIASKLVRHELAEREYDEEDRCTFFKRLEPKD